MIWVIQRVSSLRSHSLVGVAQLWIVRPLLHMKSETKTDILMVLPPALLVFLFAAAGIASAFSIQVDSLVAFRIFATLWICCSLACLVRGVWILKSDRRIGRLCIVLAVLYLFILALLVPART